MNRQTQWLFEIPFASDAASSADRSFESMPLGQALTVVLRSPRFRNDSRLQAAANDRPPMRQGEQGLAVQKLQQAFIDLGFPMPVSTRRRSSPDGIYSAETAATVRKFQQKYGLKVDGIVGRNTMSRLDQLFISAPSTPPTPPPASSCGNLLIWINAFIPRDVLGYTFTVPAGPHAGKTAVPCPLVATPTNPNCFRLGYLTDQRTFDNRPTASVRMRSIAEIQLVSPKLLRANHQTSGTTEINKSTGAVTCNALADMKRCKFQNFASSPPFPSGDFLIKLSLKAAASDPCVNLAADIDYEGNIEILCSPSRGTIEVGFNGKVDSFPAFEMYASLNGTTKPLFRLPPPPGNTVVNLLGGASTPVSGKVVFDCSLISSRASVTTTRTLKTRPFAQIR